MKEKKKYLCPNCFHFIDACDLQCKFCGIQLSDENQYLREEDFLEKPDE